MDVSIADMLLMIGQILVEGGAELRGVLLHAGDSYALNDPDALAAAAENERQAAVAADTILPGGGAAIAGRQRRIDADRPFRT